jgi:hypothetical protein
MESGTDNAATAVATTNETPEGQRANSPRDAFLLYNVEDWNVVETITQALRARGVTTWYDRLDLKVGDEWAPAEDKALRKAATVVVFLGAHGWGPSQRKYMERLAHLEKRTLPVLLADPGPDAMNAFGGFFWQRQRIDFQAVDDQRAIDRLIDAIREKPAAPRSYPNIERFVSAMVNGSDDDRSEALESLIGNLNAFDHPALRYRIRQELVGRFSPATASDSAFAARDPNQIPSIRSWLLSTLAWIRGDDSDSRALLLWHLDPRHEPESAVRFWTLASLFQTGLETVGTASEQDPSREVSLLATSIAAMHDPRRLEEIRATLRGGTFGAVWPALRALRIVPLPDLIPDLCQLLESTMEGPVAYDTLYALANRSIAEAASAQIVATYGLERTIQFILAAAEGSSHRSVQAFAKLLAFHDTGQVKTAFRKVAGEAPSSPTVVSLLRLLSAQSTRADDRLVLPGYATDTSGKLDDQLDLNIEVETLCAVMLAKDVTPPLSIGLFGDWGTGKSFFMDLMRVEVERIAKKAIEEESSKFHARVAQITFNAWHYVDANLWASLVSHILEELVVRIEPGPDPEATRKQLMGKLETAKQFKAEAEQERDRMAAAKRKIESDLQTLAADRARKQIKLAELRTADLWRLIKDDPNLRSEIESTLKALGLPAVRSGIGDLEAALGEARTVLGRARALLFSVETDVSKLTIVGIIALLVILFPAVAWAMGQWPFKDTPIIAALSAAITDAAAALFAVAAAIRKPLGKARDYLTKLEQARDKALEVISTKKAQQSEIEIDLERQLNEIRAKEQSATQELSATAAAIREIEAKIAEIDEGRSLAKFLLQRVQTDDYRKHLGLVSTIRRDFSKLSQLLKGPSLDKTHRPIERIVLYVDDLDRCPAERVGEVLQAVHLLLAFDLFIVVVGVDPRWVAHALEEIYPAFKASHPVDGSPVQAENWITTPQNYLEKIFQIPYSLRPMGETGFGNLMRKLLPETREESDGETHATGDATTIEAARGDTHEAESEHRPPAGQPRGALDGASGPSSAREQPPPTSAAEGSGARVETGAGIAERKGRRLNPESLQIRKWERDFAQRLHGLIPTPRAAKRFTNVYRLLKAHLPAQDLRKFEGTATEPGDFRAPMLLLSILTGFPEVAERLFARIAAATPPETAPRELFDALDELGAGKDVEARLRVSLQPLLADGLTDSSLPYVEWIPAVSRFSFRVARSSPRTRPDLRTSS